MFAEVAQDKMSAADAAKTAQSQFKVIYNKWRNAKKI
jgi:hypothetical protein